MYKKCVNPKIMLYEHFNNLSKKKFLDVDIYKQKIKQKDKDLNSYSKKTIINCSKCLHCKHNKSLEWSVRLGLERQLWKRAYFITLTYDDDKLPFMFSKTGHYITGEIGAKIPLLTSYDMKKFLRKITYKVGKNNYRYFYSAEYGTKTHRPHYHLILFTDYGFDIMDVINTKVSARNYGVNDYLTSAWGNGHVLVGEADYGSMFYVAQYTMKKLKTKESVVYFGDERKLEFVSMSKKVPLGFDTFAKNPQWLLNGRITPYFDELPSIPIPLSFIRFAKRNKLLVEELDYFESLKQNEFFSFVKKYNKINLKNKYENTKYFIENKKRKL